MLGSSPRRSLREQATDHTAPYQALPVQGPFVADAAAEAEADAPDAAPQAYTPAFPILEPDEAGPAAPARLHCVQITAHGSAVAEQDCE